MFGHGFASAGLTKAANINGISERFGGDGSMPWRIARVTAAAIVGGTISDATGGKFANGAVTAAFGQAFNGESAYSKNNSSTTVKVAEEFAVGEVIEERELLVDATMWELNNAENQAANALAEHGVTEGIKKLAGKGAGPAGVAFDVVKFESRSATYQQQFLREHIREIKNISVVNGKAFRSRIISSRSLGLKWENVGKPYTVKQNRVCVGGSACFGY